MRYVLASGSPRRKELLKQVVPEFEIIPAVSEEKTKCSEPCDIVKELSFQKASEIFHKILTDKSEVSIVIGADTIVSFNHRVLGKPKDRDEAVSMIKMLQGNSHEVYTGVTIFFQKDGENFSHTFYEETKVEVEPMTDAEIQAYVNTGESDDKAGAYAVQGRFAIFIKGLVGDYYNVVGLPIARLYKEMKELNLL